MPRPVGNFDAKALREHAEQAKGDVAAIHPDHLIQLLDSHETALRLANAVEELRNAEMGNAGVTSDSVRGATAGEVRNKWRRILEKQGMNVDAALRSFRATTGQAPR